VRILLNPSCTNQGRKRVAGWQQWEAMVATVATDCS